MKKYDFLGNVDIAAIEEMYQNFLENPESVPEEWAGFFKGFDFALAHFKSGVESQETFDIEFKVINLIEAYRKRGHLFTKTNPVRTRRKYSPTLDIENFGLSENDLNETFQSGNYIGIGKASLKDILDHLEET